MSRGVRGGGGRCWWWGEGGLVELVVKGRLAHTAVLRVVEHGSPRGSGDDAISAGRRLRSRSPIGAEIEVARRVVRLGSVQNGWLRCRLWEVLREESAVALVSRASEATHLLSESLFGAESKQAAQDVHLTSALDVILCR